MDLQDFFGGNFTKQFLKDSRITIMLITAGVTLICETITYILQIILFRLSIELIPFVKIVLIEAIYNVIIIIIIYPIIGKAGEVLKRIFNEKKVFTKYY